MARQQAKQLSNDAIYANLRAPPNSRQVACRAVRKAVKHQIAVAKSEAIANRRKKFK